eukprot:5355788-Pyramimonas_sp.AAC.1
MGRLGALLERLIVVLGTDWEALGRSWGPLGPTWGPRWGPRGLSLGAIRPPWAVRSLTRREFQKR